MLNDSSISQITIILGISQCDQETWRKAWLGLGDLKNRVNLVLFEGENLTYARTLSTQKGDSQSLDYAISQSKVVFLVLINLREQAELIIDSLKKHKPLHIIAFDSIPEIMNLNRVGNYQPGETNPSKGMSKLVKTLLGFMTGGRDEDILPSFAKLSGIASKLIPLLPNRLSGLRTWLLSYLYWRQPSVHNRTQLLRLIMRDCLNKDIKVENVEVFPLMGCYDPDSNRFFSHYKEYFSWAKKQGLIKEGNPLVAVVFFRKHACEQQPYLKELIDSLKNIGFNVLPIFVSGIEVHIVVREWLSQLPVDLLINTIGFALIEGPVATTQPGKYMRKAKELLTQLNTPYVIFQPLMMQNIEEWQEKGVVPAQSLIMHDIPEMDGSTFPAVIAAVKENALVGIPDRIKHATSLAKKWVNLRHKDPKKVKIAFIVYDFPPGQGKLGTAALLDVPASLAAIASRLKQEGYDLDDFPSSSEKIGAIFNELVGIEPPFSVSLADYYQLIPSEIEEQIRNQWGPPPGDIAAISSQQIRLNIKTYGNLLIGAQPHVGAVGDPLRFIFDKSFSPHHQYALFYYWITKKWDADVLVHVGMHGTAEWMPGLQTGMSQYCWPDRLLGETPHIYLYPLNNPSEASIAKRRGYAVILSHLIPPYAKASLYQDLKRLKKVLESSEFNENENLLPDLKRKEGETKEEYQKRASQYLNDLESRLISQGLHIFGQTYNQEQLYLLLDTVSDVPQKGSLGLSQILKESKIPNYQEVKEKIIRKCCIGKEKLGSVWKQLCPFIPLNKNIENILFEGISIREGIKESVEEMEHLMNVLKGGFVPPALGGDLLRSGSAVLPSGGNIHGVDPWRLPSDYGYKRGVEMAKLLIKRHYEEYQKYPETVGVTLWALDTIKTEGETLGMILGLLGAEPERDGQGKIWKYRLIPLEELGHPRIDVFLDLSSVFRDTFPMLVDMIDGAIKAASNADEPLDQNFVRAHCKKSEAEGVPWSDTSARLFSRAPGKYGNGVSELVEDGNWQNESELAETYAKSSSFAYGKNLKGKKLEKVFQNVIGTVDHVCQAIDSVEFGLTDMSHYYSDSGIVQKSASLSKGKAVPLTYMENCLGNLSAHEADELVNIEVRTKLLNPAWYEPLVKQGHNGVSEISTRFTHLLGLGVVAKATENWVFDQMAQAFVWNEEMRNTLKKSNPQAFRNIVSRLIEANARSIWESDEDTINKLKNLYEEVEDHLEEEAV